MLRIPTVFFTLRRLHHYQSIVVLRFTRLGKFFPMTLTYSCYFVYRLCMDRWKTRNNKHRQVPDVNNNMIRTTCLYRRSLLGALTISVHKFEFPITSVRVLCPCYPTFRIPFTVVAAVLCGSRKIQVSYCANEICHISASCTCAVYSNCT